MYMSEEAWEFEGRRVAVTNPGKPFWPDDGLTKVDLLRYYRDVGPVLLPHIKDRPLVMKSFPEGVNGPFYFRQNLAASAPAWLQRFETEPRSEHRTKRMPIVNDVASLVWLANQAAIEIHPWLSHTDAPDRPDLVVFDLDVSTLEHFPLALRTAVGLHSLLDGLGLRAFPKTTGGDGLHVYVPIERRYSFDETRAWAKRIAEQMASERPERITTDATVATRMDKVLIDYAQNGYGKTTVAAYSVRPLPGATVSAPLLWEEVAAGSVRPSDFRISTMRDRLEREGDLLASMLELHQRLPAPR